MSRAQQFDVHPKQAKQWRDQLTETATGVFDGSDKGPADPVIDVKEVHARIGQSQGNNRSIKSSLKMAINDQVAAIKIKPSPTAKLDRRPEPTAVRVAINKAGPGLAIATSKAWLKASKCLISTARDFHR